KRPNRSGFRSEIGFAIGGSYRRAVEFQFILWKLGIHSIIKKEWMKKSTKFFYRILISRSSEKEKLVALLEKTKYLAKFDLFQERLGQVRKTPGISKIDTGLSVRIKSIKTIGSGTVVGWETIGNHEIASYCG